MFQGRHGIEQQLLQDAAYRVIINAGDEKRCLLAQKLTWQDLLQVAV